MSDLRKIADNAAVYREWLNRHAQAVVAVERAVAWLEVAGPGHAREVALLQAIRRRLSRHLVDGGCD